VLNLVLNEKKKMMRFNVLRNNLYFVFIKYGGLLNIFFLALYLFYCIHTGHAIICDSGDSIGDVFTTNNVVDKPTNEGDKPIAGIPLVKGNLYFRFKARINKVLDYIKEDLNKTREDIRIINKNKAKESNDFMNRIRESRARQALDKQINRNKFYSRYRKK
jgi:hypothetical protein